VRSYHPDRNPSASAEEKVRHINAAYAILGNPDQRARYDAQRSMLRVDEVQHETMGYPGVAMASWFGVAVLGAVLILFSPILIPPMLNSSSSSGLDDARSGVAKTANRLTVASDIHADSLDTPPAQQQERKITEVASTLGRNDGVNALAGIAAPVAAGIAAGRKFAEMTLRPVRQHIVEVPSVAVEKPPIGVPAALAREAEKILPKNRDGDALGAILKDSRSPNIKLAIATKAPPPVVQAASVQTRPKTKPQPLKTSFNCAAVRTWAAASVCRNARFASLDRQLARLWGDAISQADASERARLIESDRRFLAGRDACASDECIDAAYSAQIGRIRQISGEQRSQ
jgi:uncharacterized protein YecT (DUF1311 family)